MSAIHQQWHKTTNTMLTNSLYNFIIEMVVKYMHNHDDMKFNFQIGNIEVNILFVHFMPPNPNWIEENHCHSTYELHLIPSGQGIVEIEEKTYRLSPGSFYLTGPGVYHKQTTDKNDPMSEYCVKFELRHKTNKFSSAPTEELNRLSELLKHTSFWFGKDEYDCIGLFEKIKKELDERQIGFYSSICNHLFQILIYMCRSYSNSQKALYQPPVKTLDDERIDIIDGILFHGYHKPITIADLCDRTKLSRRHLQRVFLEHYKVPFKQKLISVRLENAKYLLRSTDLSIGEVAEKTGFSSSTSFGKAFKRNIGIAPSLYRKKHC